MLLDMDTNPRNATESTVTHKHNRKCACKCLNTCRCFCPCRDHCNCDKDCKSQCGEKGPARNLIVSIDGTSNQFGLNNTNVVELHSRVEKNTTAYQLTFYVSGIGTYAATRYPRYALWRQRCINLVDMVIARNFEKIVQQAYRWLSDNYQDGDRIFLFGFSRGAYQVRVLAGMIESVGLLYAGNLGQVPFAYELYSGRHKGRENKNEELVNHFKLTLSRAVKVHFLGVWDTVSSVGIKRGKSLPLTTSASHICFLRHALALDERRVKFLPEYLGGGSALSPIMDGGAPVSGERGNKIATKKKEAENNMQVDISVKLKTGSLATFAAKMHNIQTQESAENDVVPTSPHVKEVWFAGAHSDIGGGSKENLKLNLSSAPLLWMENQATFAGLRVKVRPNGGEWNWTDLQHDKPVESLRKAWWLLEFLPIKRLTHTNADHTTRKFHRGKGRKIVPHQLIHASVAFKSEDYRPAARWIDKQPKPWETLVGKGQLGNFAWAQDWYNDVEMDLFDASHADYIKQQLCDTKYAETDRLLSLFKRLSFIVSSPRGSETILKLDFVKDLVAIFLDTDAPLTIKEASAACIAQLTKYRLISGQKSSEDEDNLYSKVIDQITGVLSPKDDIPSQSNDLMESGFILINSLLQNYHTRILLLERSNILQQLIRMRNSHDESKKQLKAAELLAALAARNDSVPYILMSSALKTLPEVLRFEYMHEPAMTFLLNLVPYPKVPSAIDSTPGLVRAVFELSEASQSMARLALMFFVTLVCSDPETVPQKLSGLGLIEWLVKLYQKNLGSEDNLHIQNLFLQYACDEDTRQSVFTTDVLRIVVGALKDDNGDMREAALSFLRSVAEDNVARSIVCERSIIQDLVALRNSDSERICQLKSQEVLSEIARMPDAVSLLLEADVIRNTLSSDDDDVLMAGAEFLEALAPHSEARTKMLESNIVGHLRALTGGLTWHGNPLTTLAEEQKSPTVQIAAEAALIELRKYDNVVDWEKQKSTNKEPNTIGNAIERKLRRMKFRRSPSHRSHESPDPRTTSGSLDIVDPTTV